MLQRRQFETLADPVFVMNVAKSIVAGKLRNSIALLERLRRSRIAATEFACDAIRDLSAASRKSADLDTLRGYEGAGAREFYEAYAMAFRQGWSFQHRIRRPPTDPINSMLSLGYTLIFYQMVSFLRTAGLSPYAGYLHMMRQGHPALASDMVEEFRSPVVESLVLQMVNNRIVTPADFNITDGACYLSPESRKKFLEQFDRKMRTEIAHPHSGAHTDYRGAMAIQVHAMANVIRGAATSYIPFETR